MKKEAKVKKILCFGMVALMSVSNIQSGLVRAEGTGPADDITQSVANVKENNWNYAELEDGTLMVYGYWGSDTEVVIPSEIEGKSVTSIGDFTFFGRSNLTSITIPKSVTSIKGDAFYGCSSLMSITIPEGVKSIGDRVFAGCSSLTEILVDESNTEYCSENGALYNKNKSALICCPAGKIGSFHISEGVTRIEDFAFDTCSSLTSIDIPEGVMSIGEWVFYECRSLVSITIPERVTSIGWGTFCACKSLTSIIIPEGVTSINDEAFDGCGSLTSITIPEGVTSIGNSVFKECKGLVIFGRQDSYAHKYAVDNNIPFKLLNEGNNEIAGDNGSNMQDITEPSENPSQPEKPSDNTNISQNQNSLDSSIGQTTPLETTQIVQSDGCKYKITSQGTVTLTGLKKTKTKKLSIPKTININGTKYIVTAIGDKAFKNAKITSLNIGSDIKTIGTSAFEGCKSLTKVTIGSGVTKIGKNAFKNCKKLKTITIKSTKIKSISKNAFKGIKSTTKIKVPKKKYAAYQKLLKKAGISKKVRIVK